LPDGPSRGTDKNKKGVRCSIAQSEEYYYTEIVDLLNRLDIKFTDHRRSYDLVHSLNIPAKYFREYIDRLDLPRLDKHDIDYTKFIISLSNSGLKSFMDAFFKGDGYYHKNTKIISQNKGNIFNAVQLACTLLGIKTTVQKGDGKCLNIVLSDNRFTTGQRLKKNISRSCDVFCVNNKNGFFVAEQGNIITITGNSALYGVGASKLAKELKVPRREAQILLDAFWRKNYAVTKFAAEIEVKEINGQKWALNPLNNIWYSLRSEKDIFSTINQSAGSFIFKMWVNEIRKLGIKITAQFHDEIIIRCKKGLEDEYSENIVKALDIVNNKLKLTVPIKCEVKFGQYYDSVH
jgi:hypothetical protein